MTAAWPLIRPGRGCGVTGLLPSALGGGGREGNGAHFSDAARVRVHDLRGDLGSVLRLLAVGLPLTVLAGWGLAAWLFPALGVWVALLVGAAEEAAASGAGGALVELAIGVAVGAAVGFAGGWLLRWARNRRWAAGDFTGIAVLALALLAYLASVAVDGNGFVAAFCGGIAFGAAAGQRGPEELAFLEQTGSAVSLLVWLAFGAIAVPIAFHRLDGTLLLYAVLSLTVVRMCRSPWPCSAAAPTVPPCSSSAGLAPGGWRPSSSPSSPWRRSGRERTARWRSSGSP
jgi:NhaP-type Na+/H+ or K+/H+ antiporter